MSSFINRANAFRQDLNNTLRSSFNRGSSVSNSKSLFYDDLMASKCQTFTISSGQGAGVTCLISDNINFNFATEWSGKNSRQDNMKQINEYIQSLGSYAEAVTGRMSSISLESIATSVVFWRGADYMRLSFPCLLLAVRPDYDVTRDYLWLLKGVTPSFDSQGYAAATLVRAPNDYVPTQQKAEDVRGAYSLRISKWFKTPRWFVMTECSFEMSKQTTTAGHPLYAKGQVSFQSFRYLGYSDIEQLFLTGGV